MRNRYGNFIGGKYFYPQNEIGTPYWSTYVNRSAWSLIPNFPVSDARFDYTSKEGGMWGIKSAFEFSKLDNRSIPSTGLTEALDSTWFPGTQGQWIAKDLQSRTINLSRYANRSVRLVFRASILRDYIGNIGASDMYIDKISVSGITYGFEASAESFQTTTTNSYSIDYNNLTWTTMASTATRDRFSRANVVNTIGASSNGNFAVRTNYNSTWGELPDHTMWLRSPVITLGANPILSFEYYLDIGGTNIIFTYLDLQ